jgi:hypothetical protein
MANDKNKAKHKHLTHFNTRTEIIHACVFKKSDLYQISG